MKTAAVAEKTAADARAHSDRLSVDADSAFGGVADALGGAWNMTEVKKKCAGEEEDRVLLRIPTRVRACAARSLLGEPNKRGRKATTRKLKEAGGGGWNGSRASVRARNGSNAAPLHRYTSLGREAILTQQTRHLSIRTRTGPSRAPLTPSASFFGWGTGRGAGAVCSVRGRGAIFFCFFCFLLFVPGAGRDFTGGAGGVVVSVLRMCACACGCGCGGLGQAAARGSAADASSMWESAQRRHSVWATAAAADVASAWGATEAS